MTERELVLSLHFFFEMNARNPNAGGMLSYDQLDYVRERVAALAGEPRKPSATPAEAFAPRIWDQRGTD